MHQQHIGIAFLPHLQSLPGANGDDLHFVAGFLLEQRDQHIEQTRVLGRGGGRQDQVRVGRRGWRQSAAWRRAWRCGGAASPHERGGDSRTRMRKVEQRSFHDSRLLLEWDEFTAVGGVVACQR